MAAAAPRISVVVAAYAPGDGILRVIESLDAQTMPQDEFETIIVDDGSPDDTFTRLQGLAATRPNMRVHRIENSGWPSRPRNVAADLARGEWLLFMDHDDSLFPDGLRRAAEYAAETRADLLSPKESKTDDAWWGMPALADGNVPNALVDGGIERVLPMVPHKLYRREFLAEHGIRFPEGRRMLWEDIYVNVAAWRHAERVAVLADTPLYLWHASATNNSKSYGPRTAEYWDRLDDLIAFIDTTLDGPEHADTRRAVLIQQYRDRLVGRFARMLDRSTPDEVRMAEGRVRRLQERYIPEEWDSLLGPIESARAVLVRAERPDLLRQLVVEDGDIAARTSATEVAWHDGRLHLGLESRWLSKREGGPLRFAVRDGRVVRRLPPELEAALPERVLDVTDSAPSFGLEVGVRDRAGRITWELPCTPAAAFEPVDEQHLALTARAAVVLDPERANGRGGPLDPVVWDLTSATRWLGSSRGSAVRWSGQALAALSPRGGAVAYGNLSGNLSLDLGGRLRNIVKDGRADPERAAVTDAGLVLPLPGVDAPVPATLPTAVRIVPLGAGEPVESTGRVVADEAGVRLESALPEWRGRARLWFRVGEGEWLESVLTAERHGDAVDLRRYAPPPARTPLRALLRRRLARLVRRTGTSARRLRDRVRARG